MVSFGCVFCMLYVSVYNFICMIQFHMVDHIGFLKKLTLWNQFLRAIEFIPESNMSFLLYGIGPLLYLKHFPKQDVFTTHYQQIQNISRDPPARADPSYYSSVAVTVHSAVSYRYNIDICRRKTLVNFTKLLCAEWESRPGFLSRDPRIGSQMFELRGH